MINEFKFLRIRVLLLLLLFANFAIASFAEETFLDEELAENMGEPKGETEFTNELRELEENSGENVNITMDASVFREHDSKCADDSKESRMDQLEVETLKKEDGCSVTSLKKDCFKLRVTCFVNQRMIEEITRLIREKEDYLFNRVIPPISFNVGTRFELGMFEADTGTSSTSKYPPIAASLSIPLYQPDKYSLTQARKQLFLDKMFNNLRDLEYLQRNIELLREKRMVILKVIETTGPSKLDTYYRTEQEILKSISEINRIIRFLEANLGVSMLELYERFKY